MNGYIGTMTTADTLGMYAVLLILGLIALGLLCALVVQIRDNDTDGLYPIGDALAKSEYADLTPEENAADRLQQRHVTPLLLDQAWKYIPEGYTSPATAAPVPPAPMVGRHRRELLTDVTGEWSIAEITGELVGAR